MSADVCKDAREQIRCPHCRLWQYITSSGHCRRCRLALRPPPPPPEAPPPLPLVRACRGAGPPAERGFAAALCLARCALGLSQRQLAQRMGVRRTYISKVENGKACPVLDSIARMAAALGISIRLLVELAAECGEANFHLYCNLRRVYGNQPDVDDGIQPEILTAGEPQSF